MSQPVAKPELGKELTAITEATGTAIVRYGNRTFIVVEMEAQPVDSAAGAYRATDPEEAADLIDAVDDTDNPTFSTDEAMKYLQSLRKNRERHDKG